MKLLVVRCEAGGRREGRGWRDRETADEDDDDEKNIFRF